MIKSWNCTVHDTKVSSMDMSALELKRGIVKPEYVLTFDRVNKTGRAIAHLYPYMPMRATKGDHLHVKCDDHYKFKQSKNEAGRSDAPADAGMTDFGKYLDQLEADRNQKRNTFGHSRGPSSFTMKFTSPMCHIGHVNSNTNYLIVTSTASPNSTVAIFRKCCADFASEPPAVEVEDLMIADEGTEAEPTTLWTDGPRCFQKVDSTGLGVMQTGAPWSENANEILAEWPGGGCEKCTRGWHLWFQN